MKVFEVTTEHCKMNSKEIQTVVRYVTSDDDSLQSVVKHYANHCSQYEEDFKGVREVLNITQNIKRT